MSQPSTVLLATWPASSAERYFALTVVLVSLVAFGATAPWAKLALPAVWAFVPIYESALILNDLITAVLLFGQFRIARSWALLVLASGYVFTALVTVAHGLTFPNLFSPGGLLGAGPQSTAWLYMFWHGGFPLFVIAYALTRDRPGETLPAGRSGWAIAAVAGAVVAAAAVSALAATAGHDGLPTLMSGARYAPAMIGVVSGVWLTSLLALAMLVWRRRLRTVLDLWLAVVMCAWLLDIALSAVLNGGRFDLGFYAGRVYGLLATGFVLVRLLLENGALYDRLVVAHGREQRRTAELRALTQRLEATNRELGDTNLQLREQSRFKSEFLANMSHELRTPLNAIIGFSDLFKEGMAGPVNDRQRNFATHIFQSGHHLLALINDILDLSKIEAGKFEIELAAVHLKSLLAEAESMVAERAAARGVRLQTEFHGALGVMQADRRRLVQILLNLLSNAIKFSPDGGAIGIRLAAVPAARAAQAMPGFRHGVRMPLPTADDFPRYLEISITDSGIGIAADQMQRLFQPFTQIANMVTRTGEGTGLGLAMVHRLADLHGGTVAVTSEPGQGSCFTVWLPWREGQLTEADAARPLTPVPVSRKLALIVEDNDQAATLMRTQLEAEGFEVRHVASAEAALALVGQCLPDVITLDILLPGMDGWQFLARLKETPRWDSIPVVVVSVAADQGKGFSLGAALVLQKPIGRDALAKGLERLGLVASAQREITVLVIDDDASAVELLAAQLHRRDYIVLRALGGREGIDLARHFRPDLITLDLEMPEVNGFDVVAALKGHPTTAHIPIAVVTSKDLTADDRRELNGHILDIVGKADFNHGWFVGEVQRAMSRPH